MSDWNIPIVYIKSNPSDLQRAIKQMQKLVAQSGRLRLVTAPLVEVDFNKKSCFTKFAFKGNSSDMHKHFSEHGFTVASGLLAGQMRINFKKTFSHGYLTYTAWVSVYPDLNKVSMKVEAVPTYCK